MVVLSETWLEEGDWGRLSYKMPKGFVWEKQWARRESKKGRAMGGNDNGGKEGVGGKGRGRGGEGGDNDEEGEVGWVGSGGVYVNKDLQRKLEELKEWMGGREEGVRVVIGGDFNARTGGEGGEMWWDRGG